MHNTFENGDRAVDATLGFLVEVQVETGVAAATCGRFGLVGAVVQGQGHIQAGWDFPIELGEEVPECSYGAGGAVSR